MFYDYVLYTDIFAVIEDKRLDPAVKIKRMSSEIYGYIFFILDEQCNIYFVVSSVAFSAAGIQYAVKMSAVLRVDMHVGIRYVFAIAL